MKKIYIGFMVCIMAVTLIGSAGCMRSSKTMDSSMDSSSETIAE